MIVVLLFSKLNIHFLGYFDLVNGILKHKNMNLRCDLIDMLAKTKMVFLRIKILICSVV